MKQLVICSLAVALLTGCSSKLILYPGISGRFIEEKGGEPIAGVKVIYKNIGDNFTKETITDANGGFSFTPDFTNDYAGFPTESVGLQVSLSLATKPKHNWSKAGYFVKNTDINNATIDAGVIKVNSFFLTPE